MTGFGADRQQRETTQHQPEDDARCPALVYRQMIAVMVRYSDQSPAPATASIPIIAMSAGTNLLWLAERTWVDGLLSQPLELDTLLAHITMLLGQPVASSPAIAVGD